MLVNQNFLDASGEQKGRKLSQPRNSPGYRSQIERGWLQIHLLGYASDHSSRPQGLGLYDAFSHRYFSNINLNNAQNLTETHILARTFTGGKLLMLWRMLEL